jgi:hypothetical protein
VQITIRSLDLAASCGGDESVIRVDGVKLDMSALKIDRLFSSHGLVDAG